MSLKAAIRSLERKAMKVGTCIRCGGRGSYETILVENGTPERNPRGCQGCGKVAYVKHIILED